jgi:acyl carrier protein
MLEERYERARRSMEGSDEAAVGPVAPEEMSGEDRALLENTAAMGVWKLLTDRYAGRRLVPETSMQLDLNIDSLGWVNLTLGGVNLTLEIGEKTGVELDEEAIESLDTVRDLLREVASGVGGTTPRFSPLERPEEVLDDRQLRCLKPLGPARSVMARSMFLLNRIVMRVPFRLRVEGLENLPDEGPYITAPRQLTGCVRSGRSARLQRAAAHLLGGLDGRCLRQYADSSAVSRRWSRSPSAAQASRAWPSGLRCSSAVRAWSGSPKVNVHPQEACSRSSRVWQCC